MGGLVLAISLVLVQSALLNSGMLNRAQKQSMRRSKKEQAGYSYFPIDCTDLRPGLRSAGLGSRELNLLLGEADPDSSAFDDSIADGENGSCNPEVEDCFLWTCHRADFDAKPF